MKIFLAKFNGRKLNACGIMYDIEAYCYGNDATEAHLELYNRYQDISRWKLVEVPIVKVGDCKPNDHIYIVENGRLIGDKKPHESFYMVLKVTDSESVLCRGGDGCEVNVRGDLDCIVHTNQNVADRSETPA